MAPDVPTLKWLFFSFRGRIARQSFILAVLFLILPQLALLLQIGLNDGNVPVLDALMGLFLISALASFWCLVAVVIKRLHDINAPVGVIVLLFAPPFTWLFLAVLAFLPSRQEVNEHGPPPFPEDTI